VPIEDEILRAAERRRAEGAERGVAEFLAELVRLGFEHRFEQLYRRYETGEISLERFADEMGLNLRDLYEALERRGLPTSNLSQ